MGAPEPLPATSGKIAWYSSLVFLAGGWLIGANTPEAPRLFLVIVAYVSVFEALRQLVSQLRPSRRRTAELWRSALATLCLGGLVHLAGAGGSVGVLLVPVLFTLAFSLGPRPALFIGGLGVLSSCLGGLTAGSSFYEIRPALFIGAVVLVSSVLFAQASRSREHSLRIALKEEQRVVRARTRILGILSHEIRTPLTELMGTVDRLADTRLNDLQLALVATLEDSGGSLRHIVNDVLDFTKIESGNLEMNLVPTDPRNLAQRAMLRVQGCLRKAVRTELVVEDAVPPALHLDPIRLTQVLGNLLNNAAKFTEVGVIHLRLSYNERTLSIAVEDSGCGIHAAQLTSVFDAFRQAEGPRSVRAAGTGLGLTICRELVRLMGGKIHVESVYGEGARFSFTVSAAEAPEMSAEEPLSAAALICAPSSRSFPSLSSPELNSEEAPWSKDLPLVSQALESGFDAKESKGLRVLLVDDNRVNLKVGRVMLKKLGCAVRIAENGERAVEYCEHHDFDLILMDCEMPVMDGLTAARIIRNFGKQTPIYALTNNINLVSRARHSDLGMGGFLAKPLSAIMLREVINEVAATESSEAGMG